MFKIGHAHGGLGKVKVENEAGFEVGFHIKKIYSPISSTPFLLQDLKGVVAVSNQYCTVEKFVEAYCDLHIFKFGSTYKALM